MKQFKKLIAVVLVTSLWCTNANVVIAKTDAIQVDEVASKELVPEEVINTDNELTNTKIFETENYIIEFVLTDSWDTGYNVNVRIDNISDTVIHNWYLQVTNMDEISNIWNAEVSKADNNKTTIKCQTHNQYIQPGECIEFGYSVNKRFTSFPDTCNLVSNSNKEELGYDIEYIVNSAWENNADCTIKITNTSDKILEDWTLEFYLDASITEIWNATVQNNTESHYIIRNAEYNSNISPNETIEIGFLLEDTNGEDEPSNYKLYSYEPNQLPGNSLQEILDYLETVDMSQFDLSDDDNDGLPNFYEEMIGSDKDNQDTDGDGLPDGYEVFGTFTDPRKIDTDANGVNDNEEDKDSDGLTNIYEYELGINSNDPDTDGDKLQDAKELEYGMNPNKQCTLDDGIMDGDRIFDINKDIEPSDNNLVNPILEVKLEGKQLNEFIAEKVELDDQFFNEDIPGYVANGYEFIVEGTIDGAKLSFELDEQLLNNPEYDLAIYYLNEETQLLEEVGNQYFEGNRLCADLEHFSKYIVLDKKRYYAEAFQFEVLAPTEGEMLKQSFDVTFSLDESGSISNRNFQTMKNESIELISKLSDKDRVATFAFGNHVRRINSFVDKNSAINGIKTIVQANGRTVMYDSIYNAIQEYKLYSNDKATKIIILVTDGYDNSSRYSREYVVNLAKQNNIVIYTVGVGSTDTTTLKTIANETGGQYYYINNFSSLDSVFEQIVVEADLYKDSDGDGISDYHEKMIASGKMMVGTGQPLRGLTKLDYLNPDSDGDGLDDGQEIEIKSTFGKKNFYVYLNSNPCIEDTDVDGVNDYWEDYIGTSALSKLNIIQMEGMESRKKYLPVNVYKDWLELFGLFDDVQHWSFPHTETQKHIVEKYSDIDMELGIKKLSKRPGRVDLYTIPSGIRKIWEVKPASYISKKRQEKALKQLEGYEKALNDSGLNFEHYQHAHPTSKGGYEIANDEFEVLDKRCKIQYQNLGNGLILYSFKIKPTPQTVVQPETEKENEYEFETNAIVPTYDSKGWGVILVAGGAIAGTLIEDVITGGAGVLDDLVCFGWAYQLIFG